MLDPVTGWCRGCARSAEEISAWPRAGNLERQQIIDKLKLRKEKIGTVLMTIGLIVSIFFSSLFVGLKAKAAEPPLVAAAANLQFAIGDLVAGYKRAGGGDLRMVFGSSGQFVQQITEGAPFALFLAADEASIEQLAKRGLTRDSGMVYARGRLVLFTRTGSPVDPTPDLSGLKAALAAGSVMHFAIANPELAPYGRAAQDVLQRAGLWPTLQGKLVIGENISQTLQFALAGGAEATLVAYSLVLNDKISRAGRYALIPKEQHQPINQRMALLKSSGTEAEGFYRYVLSADAQAILMRFGYDPGQGQ